MNREKMEKGLRELFLVRTGQGGASRVLKPSEIHNVMRESGDKHKKFGGEKEICKGGPGLVT